MPDKILDKALTVDQAQAKCDEDGPYHMKEVSKEYAEKLGLEKFLENYIKVWGDEYPTRKLGPRGGRVQCDTGRSRSIVDMTRLAKYYFPDSNVVKVRNALINIQNNKKSISNIICGDINRRVFFIGTGSGANDALDEFGWKFNKPQKREPTKKVVHNE